MPSKYKPVAVNEESSLAGKRLHLYVVFSLLKRLEKYLTDTGAQSMSAVIIVAVDEFLRDKGY